MSEPGVRWSSAQDDPYCGQTFAVVSGETGRIVETFVVIDRMTHFPVCAREVE